jgi:hypothetical protein
MEGCTMSRNQALFFAAIKGFCGAIIFVMTLFTVFAAGPLIETRFWPPVSKLQILSMTATTDGRTIIRADFTKLRDCEYVGIAWYRGTRDGNFERVPVILQREPGDQSSPDRPLGRQTAGPWIIAVPLDEIRTNSFAELFHHCHPFWMTRTEFFP